MRGSDYAELRAFLAVVDQGGFARAARQLGLSASALSQTIKALEERLGVRLLNRTTRSLAVSQAGARLLSRLRPALADLDAALADVAAFGDTPSGLLRINCPRMAAVPHLAPLVAPFLQAFPQVRLEIVAEDRLVDIVAAGFDAGIRLGEMLADDMIAVRLGGDMQMMVVASPAYLAAFGAPGSPRDLRHHRCINLHRPTDLSVYRWEFERGEERLEVAVDGPLLVNDHALALAAAQAGTGIAYLFADLVQPALASGALVQVLADWSPPFPGLYLYYPSRRQMAPALRAFIDMLAGPGGGGGQH